MGIRSETRTRLFALAVGLICTLAVAIHYKMGLFDRLEALTVDLRFCYFNIVPESDLLCLVDIDDGSLETVGQWPWPRRYMGQMVALLDELGARCIVIDLVFRTPAKPQLTAPELVDQILGRGKRVVADLGPDNVLDDDRELARAMTASGKVVLANYFTEGTSDPPLAAALATRPSLNASQVADLLNRPLEAVQADFVQKRAEVFADLMERKLTTRPALSAHQALQEVLGGEAWRQTDYRRELLAAFNRARSVRLAQDKAGWRFEGQLPSWAALPVPSDAHVVLPIPPLMQAADDLGFVSFQVDPVDGKVRHMPLLARFRGRVYRQLGFVAVCKVLGVAPQGLTVTPNGTIQLDSPLIRQTYGSPIVIEQQANKGLLLNWHVEKVDRWDRSFRHIPAARLIEIANKRSILHSNVRQMDNALQRAVQRVNPAGWRAYQQLLTQHEQLTAELQIQRGRTASAAASKPTTTATASAASSAATRPAETLIELQQRLERLEQQIRQIESATLEQLQWLNELARQQQPATDQEARDWQAVHELYQCLFEPEKVQAINARLQADVDQALRDLRKQIAGRVVLIGSTATTLADFVQTPVHRRCPGIVVHANLVNQILTKSFVTKTSTESDLLIILVAGVLYSIFASKRRAGGGLFLMLFFVAGIWLVTLLLAFRSLHVLSSLVAPSTAVVLSWAMVTLYRQVTEGRARRFLASRLGQYTSPSLVNRIVEQPGGVEIKPEARQMTCYFSDLKGFTPISEQLGPEKTVLVLNVYLEHMSEVLDRYEAFINKFQGDGIFAFFNPPLNPQDNHARLAALAALESQQRMDAVQADLANHGLTLPAALEMRIGIATGSVVVGDCGSQRKFDYTCIGDTVNLASRLESANKFFGTSIIVNDRAKRQLGSDLLTRPLGKTMVVGRTEPELIHELIGELAAAAEQQVELAETFNRALQAYSARRFKEAVDLFNACLRVSPKDVPTWRYIKLCSQYVRTPPGPDWQGVIELQEK